MDEEYTELPYKIGDFVRCAYDFSHFFSCWYDEEAAFMPFHGVVVDVSYDEGWYMESVYQIYCLDGRYRFFLEDELELVYLP
jgi:hypothetical protein